MKLAVTADTMAPGGIEDRSNRAQPRLVVVLILIMLPSFLVPAALTEPELKDPGAPVHVMVAICAFNGTVNRSPRTPIMFTIDRRHDVRRGVVEFLQFMF